MASLSTMFLRPDWKQSKDLTCGLKRTGSVLNNSDNVNDHDNDNGIELENNDGNTHNDGTVIIIIIIIIKIFHERFR